ncbi:MAG: DUF1460 domain-containing protein [Bacteroidia bacterium]|nr:DUF1460 domain-containing protein [Bacteroidia bacterium]
MARRHTLFFAFVLLGLFYANAQQIVCGPLDSLDFNKRLKKIQDFPEQKETDLMVSIGKTFLHTPYVAHTLDLGKNENLVINLKGLDCTTFIENVLAFTLMKVEQESTLAQFADQLRNIRYRDGEMDGYASRLHYFTEWISNNEKKGVLKDVTKMLGGVLVEAPRTFMSEHREAYPLLADEENFRGVVQAEAALKANPYYVIPTNRLATLESSLREGDIIAFATKIKGLDVTHTALAIEIEDRIHILHASSSGQVEISKLPLLEYIRGIKNSSGLIVARITPR